MGFHAGRFTPADSPLELRIPAQLVASTRHLQPPRPAQGPAPEQVSVTEAAPEPVPATGDGQPALEVDRVVPASGNLWIGGQQVWLGPALARRAVTLWVDQTSLHVLLDGTRIKTLPSRLGPPSWPG